MNAFDILSFRQHLEMNDPENKELRRTFHENYEWLDGYWRSNWKKAGNNAIFLFCETFGEYFWQNFPRIGELASSMGRLGLIGNSIKEDYSSTPQIVKATLLLRSSDGSPVERFKSMMELVKQIRNNLFHGGKMELVEPEVYERNKNLVRHGAEITTILLDYLELAERNVLCENA
jgi:hypothetical protein